MDNPPPQHRWADLKTNQYIPCDYKKTIPMLDTIAAATGVFVAAAAFVIDDRRVIGYPMLTSSIIGAVFYGFSAYEGCEIANECKRFQSSFD
jgi:hypothetical protein